MLLFSKSRAGFYRWTCSIAFRRGVLSKRYGKRIGTLLSIIFNHPMDRSGYEGLLERVDMYLDPFPSPTATGTAPVSIFSSLAGFPAASLAACPKRKSIGEAVGRLPFRPLRT